MPTIGPIEAAFDPSIEAFSTRLSTITLTRVGERWEAALACVDIDKACLAKSKGMDEVSTAWQQDPHGVCALDAAVSHRGTATHGLGFFRLERSDKAEQEKHDRLETRKKRYQRRSARQTRAQMIKVGLNPRQSIPKGTRLPVSNRQRHNLNQVARLSRHQANQRQDGAHKFTTELVKTHHTVVVEDLNLNAMKKGLNRGFRRAYNLATPGQILQMLKYKCAWYGRTFITVDRWFASSKICHVCKVKNKALKLQDTTWVCPSCNTSHFRDENASVNLWLEGLRQRGLGVPQAFEAHRLERLVESKNRPTVRSTESHGQEGAFDEIGALGASPGFVPSLGVSLNCQSSAPENPVVHRVNALRA